MRRNFARLILGTSEEKPIDDPSVDVSEAGLRVRPEVGQASGARVIWFHGGGYVFGAPETHVRPAQYLAARHGFEVYLPRYRLAPEHVWPRPLEDALAATDRDDDLILAGDGSGGHLAMVTALQLARAGRPPRALLLFSPNTDRSGFSLTRRRLSPMDPVVSDNEDKRLARMVFTDMAADHPQVSPVLDDLSLLPPTLVEVGSPEVLLGDATTLHQAGNAQGALVRINITNGLLHMGQLWAPWWDEARMSLDRAAAFVRRLDAMVAQRQSLWYRTDRPRHQPGLRLARPSALE
ncbi:MAG: alpha/beta hydrolase fold domain-containing protein [Pseudomonadota bacterium]